MVSASAPLPCLRTGGFACMWMNLRYWSHGIPVLMRTVCSITGALCGACLKLMNVCVYFFFFFFLNSMLLVWQWRTPEQNLCISPTTHHCTGSSTSLWWMSTKWPRRTLCVWNQVAHLWCQICTDTTHFYGHIKNKLVNHLWLSSLRWLLWSPGFIQMQSGWFLPSHSSLWIQTGPAGLHVFPHCALYWGSSPHRPWEGAGTCSALQTPAAPCLDPSSLLPDRGRTATRRVSLMIHCVISRKWNSCPRRITMC